MKSISLLAIALVMTSALAADPELKNGDFEKGKQQWRGDGKVVTLPEGGKVLELKADDKYNDEISQEIDWGKAEKMEVQFRVRGVEYKGEGIRMLAREADGSTSGSRAEVSTTWGPAKWSFNRGKSARKVQLIFSPQPGTGAIQIDDVTITTSGAAK